jgi:hypothetical protein
MRRVQSRAIEAVGYENGTLTVRFLTGETYEYAGVDRAIYDGLLASDQPWTDYGELVKQHEYRHVT